MRRIGLTLGVVLACGTAHASPGQWSGAGSALSVARATFTSELRALTLTDGSVMVPGGRALGPTSGLVASPLVDLFAGGSFAPTASMNTGRTMTGMVALADGGALVAGGGLDDQTQPALQTAERWSPGTGWSTPMTMQVARFAPTATRLVDGTVLLAGGQDATPTLVGIGSAEIFDPAANTFTLAIGTTMSVPGIGHVAAILPDGRVFFVGGAVDGGPAVTPPWLTDIFDPATGNFSSGPDALAHHEAHGGARLFDGSILYCGGCNSQTCSALSSSECEIYSPTTGAPGTIALTGSLAVGSGAQSMITLPSGKVLLSGGVSSGAALARSELFDPSTGTWSTTGALTAARNDAAMALLPDGTVLFAGGRQGVAANVPLLASAELYTPQDLPTTCTVFELDGTRVTLNEGVPCDDGNPATTGDACVAGTCVGSLRDGGLPDGATPDGGHASDAGPDAMSVDASRDDASLPDASRLEASAGDATAIDARADVTDAAVTDGASHTSPPDGSTSDRDATAAGTTQLPPDGSVFSTPPSPPSQGCQGCAIRGAKHDQAPLFVIALPAAAWLRRRRARRQNGQRDERS